MPENGLVDPGPLKTVTRAEPSDEACLTVFTPVHDTPPAMLLALAGSVLPQLGRDFEWLVLDNGTTSPATIACLRAIAKRPGVRFLESGKNLGIVEGSKRCLDEARGRYVLPVDHDDLLAPDALRVLRDAIDRHGQPAFLYSDGDKFDGASRRDAYLKPGFDPVLLLHSCYITHLAVFSRARARELGVYTDPAAEGSQDWDAVLRFVAAGHRPVHVPATLYTWRMHPGSTAANIHSKPVVFRSQPHVVSRHLEGRPAPYRVAPSPLFRNSPDWWIRAGSGRSRKDVVTIRLAREGPASAVSAGGLMAAAAEAEGRGALVHLLAEGCRPDFPDPGHEAEVLFGLFPDAVVVGGALHRQNVILDAGRYFGFGWGCESPDVGRERGDPGYFVQMWKPHSVSAITGWNAVFDPGFLRKVLAEMSARGLGLSMLGPWAGAWARRLGRRVIFHPLLNARVPEGFDPTERPEDRRMFGSTWADLLPDLDLLSERVSLAAGRAYQPATELERADHLEALRGDRPAYAEWLEGEIAARRPSPAPARGGLLFSWLTCLYERSDGAAFRNTVDAVLGQTHASWEWIVLAQGPVSAAVEEQLGRLADRGITPLRAPRNMGIIRGLRACVEAAQGRNVVPLDADDVPTPDALEILAGRFTTTPPPDFVYSDEDILSEGRPASPFLRPAWDPVLNLSTSYAWHLCAFDRLRGLELGVYSDDGADYCHDWDTLHRFGNADARIAHVPHVLHHWRAHAASTSNAGAQNPGTVASTRRVLERFLAARDRSARYELVPHPFISPQVEWHLKRLGPHPHGVTVLVLERGAARAEVLRRDAEALGLPSRTVPIEGRGPAGLRRLRDALDSLESSWVFVISDACALRRPSWLEEITKFPDLFPDTALVGGRLVDPQGLVRAGGESWDGDGRLCAPVEGRSAKDGGPYNILLRAQSVALVTPDLFAGETEFLRRALAEAPPTLALGNLGGWLGAAAQRRGRRVVFAPLVEADIRREEAIGYPSDPTSLRLWEEFLEDSARPRGRQGAAGYATLGLRFRP